MAYDEIVAKYLGLMEFDASRSNLSIAGTAVSFHCDKFNTRILKNLEDVMGYERAAQMLCNMAEKTTYDALKYVLDETDAGKDIKALPKKEQVEAFLDLFKALAYGAIVINEYSADRAVFSSDHSYLAEGWLENQERWNLDEREGPACHDIRGHLAAVMALVEDKAPDAYAVVETSCRAFKDGKVCEFIAEVK